MNSDHVQAGTLVAGAMTALPAVISYYQPGAPAAAEAAIIVFLCYAAWRGIVALWNRKVAPHA